MIYSVLSFFEFLHFYNLLFSFIFPESKFFFSIYFPSKKVINISESKIPPKFLQRHIYVTMFYVHYNSYVADMINNLYMIRELFTDAIDHTAERNDTMAGLVL